MAKVPNIRFQGYTDDWEQRKLGDLGTIQTCKRVFKEQTSEVGEIPFYKNGTIGLQADAYISRELFEEFRAAYPYPEVGDILISAVGSVGRTAEYTGEDEYFQDSNVVWLHTDGRVAKKYLKAYYQVIDWLIEGSTVKHLYNDNILNSKINMPADLSEQRRIGEFVEQMDNLITLHQRKCDELKKVKKYMLQKMFPKKGEKVPEIRFAGFTGDWEQHKLGDVGSARSGVGFPDAEQGGTSGIPFFKVSDMNIDGNENELVKANNYVNKEQIERKRWNVIDQVPAIFFAKVGAAVMLNRKRLVKTPFLLDNNTMAYIFTKNTWDYDFGKTLFETLDLAKLTQVGALPSYNSSDVENISIMLPTLKEQERIGTYFSNLDSLIALHQRKCDTLKEIKKYMLQNMFPKK
ncbi:type I restriction enzyme, S subunit [Selenomonas sp. WCT3]|uniref:restriction endonuclease subunit S n=1 Tax=Selenomonas sp. WCT3 TaxID=3158785 RepID=UPI00088F0355|nr:type I restriction enzyme, S subunit [Selenomonas ruminantium]